MNNSDNNIYLKKIFIKNLFNQKDISWDLNQDVNILGGINGSGKSTILNIIRAFFDTSASTNIKMIKLFDYAKLSFSWCEVTFRILEDSLIKEEANKSMKKVYKNGHYDFLYKKNNQSDTFFYCYDFNITNKKESSNDLVKKLVGSSCIHYITSVEPHILEKDSKLPIKDNIKTYLDFLLDKSLQKRNEIIVELMPTKDWLLSQLNSDQILKAIKYKLIENTNFKSLTNSEKIDTNTLDIYIKKVMEEYVNTVNKSDFLPEIKIKSKLESTINKFFSTTKKEINEASRLDFKLKCYKKNELTKQKGTLIHSNSDIGDYTSSDIVPFYNLSTGEKQLLLVLLEVWNTQEKNCILIMDEPDLGLHVDWKKQLIKTIREMNPNAQLILSTHAPSMIRGYFDKVKEMSQIESYNEL